MLSQKFKLDFFRHPLVIVVDQFDSIDDCIEMMGTFNYYLGFPSTFMIRLNMSGIKNIFVFDKKYFRSVGNLESAYEYYRILKLFDIEEISFS